LSSGWWWIVRDKDMEDTVFLFGLYRYVIFEI